MSYRFVASPNFSQRKSPIDTIVLHYTDGMPKTVDATSTISWLCSPESYVSSHYIVDRNGGVTQLVKEVDKAWHAKGMNSRSIGIENIAAKGEKLDPNQEASLIKLIADIRTRHNISLDQIQGHRWTQGNEGSTDCPGNLWDTPLDLSEWVSKSFAMGSRQSVNPATEESSVVRQDLKPWTVGSVSAGILKLHSNLVALGALSTGIHGTTYTKVTAYAVSIFQKMASLKPNGIFDAGTDKALRNAMVRLAKPELDYKIATLEKAPGVPTISEWDDAGLVTLKLSIGTQIFYCVSGQPNHQRFRLPGDPGSYPGCAEPLPQGQYDIGDLEWAADVDDYKKIFSPGLGSVKSYLQAKFADDRSAFYFHSDWNFGTSPGTMGCVGIRQDQIKDFVAAMRLFKPKILNVNWGL